MEFLKSLVPAVISGEGPIEHGGALPRESGPRLLRMKRLGLLAMGQTIEEDPVGLVTEVVPVTGSSRLAGISKVRLKGMTDSVVVICTDFVCLLLINFIGAFHYLHY